MAKTTQYKYVQSGEIKKKHKRTQPEKKEARSTITTAMEAKKAL